MPDDQDSLEIAAMALLQYTPELARIDSCSLVLDVSASLSLFKGPRALYRRIRKTLSTIGIPVRISMAPTATGAWLLAWQTQTKPRRILSMRSLERRLDTLPVTILPVLQPYLHWLDALGCTTLKHLVQLPRTGLVQRTSPQVGQYLDAAYGKIVMPLTWYQAPDAFHAFCDLEFHTTHTHALLAAAQRLLEQLCGWLQARQWSASSMQFLLHYEKGRHARPPACITLCLSAPAWQVKDFTALLTEQLQHERLDAPAIAIELHNVQGQPRCSQSGGLFPDPAHYQRQENQLVDLLRARLGQKSILQPQPIASYLPEHANQWVAADPSARRAGKKAKSKQDRPDSHHPFWLLARPIELTTTNDRPMYKGRALQLIHGPERIESGWWMGGQHEQRDYFVACDSLQCRYWLYRQRGSDDPRWFLHGLYA